MRARLIQPNGYLYARPERVTFLATLSPAQRAQAAISGVLSRDRTNCLSPALREVLVSLFVMTSRSVESQRRLLTHAATLVAALPVRMQQQLRAFLVKCSTPEGLAAVRLAA